MDICKIQQALGILETGEMDQHTMAAIKNYQLRIGKPPTSILTESEYDMLLKRSGISADVISTSTDLPDVDYTTDLSENRLIINEQMLSADEYYNDRVDKFEYIFLHHTAGWDNPYNVIKDWENDQRGRIGTHYVIGGSRIDNKPSKFDGTIVKCIPDQYWAAHLGSQQQHGINLKMHKNSIGIELCNFGYLTKTPSGFLTYAGNVVNEKQVIELNQPFRGYKYWHNYSDAQLIAVGELLVFLANKFNIDLKSGLVSFLKENQTTAFDYKLDCVAGKVKGILSHTNVRKDKTDVYPHPKLIQMLEKFG